MEHCALDLRNLRNVWVIPPDWGQSLEIPKVSLECIIKKKHNRFRNV